MSTPTDRPLDGMRILVVDDQRFIRGLVSQGLKGLGAQVSEASDGFEALSILGIQETTHNSAFDAMRRQRPDMFEEFATARNDFDCIVTDIRMSPMNGLEMLKAIRAGMSAARRDLPVVIMSAHSDEALIGAAIALDAHGFVAKPVSQNSLNQRILRSRTIKLPLKDAEVYRTLIIPELDEATLETDVGRVQESIVATIRAGDVAAVAGPRVLVVAWARLEVGDELSDNLLTKNGRIVAPAGTRVNEVLIAALADLSSVTELAPDVPIRRKGLTG
jgi:CheY-like chemotaxis protein